MPHGAHVPSTSFQIGPPTGVELTNWSKMVCEGAPASSCFLLPSTGVSRLPCHPRPFAWLLELKISASHMQTALLLVQSPGPVCKFNWG